MNSIDFRFEYNKLILFKRISGVILLVHFEVVLRKRCVSVTVAGVNSKYFDNISRGSDFYLGNSLRSKGNFN